MSAGYTHRGIIAFDLCELRGFQSNGFRADIRKRVSDEDVNRALCGVWPDAWKIDDDGTIVCAEVEVEHPLGEAQIEAYLRLYCALDDASWGLELRVFDRHGREASVDFDLLFGRSAALRRAR